MPEALFVIGSFFLHANTRFAFSSATPIVAIAPELNFKKSVSIPSENISVGHKVFLPTNRYFFS